MHPKRAIWWMAWKLMDSKTPTKAGVIDFSCGMGMVTGRFTVTD